MQDRGVRGEAVRELAGLAFIEEGDVLLHEAREQVRSEAGHDALARGGEERVAQRPGDRLDGRDDEQEERRAIELDEAFVGAVRAIDDVLDGLREEQVGAAAEGQKDGAGDEARELRTGEAEHAPERRGSRARRCGGCHSGSM